MRGGSRRWSRWAVMLAAALVVMGNASACIGTTSRDDFNQVIQGRGGGFTSELPLEAVDAVAAELSVDDFEIRRMNIDAPSETVVMDVRDPVAPANLDTYTVRRGEIDSVEPVRLSADDDLDQETWPVSELALDRVESMVDQALAEFDPSGSSYVTSIGVSVSGTGDGDGEAEFSLSLESARARGQARFSADGEPLEVTRT